MRKLASSPVHVIMAALNKKRVLIHHLHFSTSTWNGSGGVEKAAEKYRSNIIIAADSGAQPSSIQTANWSEKKKESRGKTSIPPQSPDRLS